MAFFGLFKKNEEDLEILLREKKRNKLRDAAAAAAFAEAGEHETARAMFEAEEGKRLLLVMGRENGFSPKLMDYAVAMAGRLNFEILAVTPGREMRQDVEALFLSRAHEKGVLVTLHHERGSSDEIVERLHHRYPALRYVLTEPESLAGNHRSAQSSIPVFDLGNFHGAAV